MSKILILLENGSQYHEFMNQQECDSHEQVICALTPFAIDFCEKNGLPFVLAEDYFSEEKYYKNKQVSESKIKELISLLNSYYSKISQERLGFSLEAGNYFFSSLYIVIGALHFRSFLLSCIIEAENPERIAVFSLKQDLPRYLKFRPQPIGNSYAKLLFNSPYKDKCNFITYMDKNLDNRRRIRINRIKNIVKQIVIKFPFIHQCYYFLKNNINFNLIDNIFVNSKNKILMLGPVYNWKYILSHRKVRASTRITWIDADEMPGPSKLKEKDIFKECLNCNKRFLNFNLSPLLYDQMGMVEATFNWMLNNFQKFKRRISQFNLVLVSTLASPQQNYIAHIAKIQKVPVIMYQHGEMNLYRDSLFLEAEEISYIDYYLTFGDWVNEKYSKCSGVYKYFKGPVSVGSSTIDGLSSLNIDSNEFILYATSKYLLNSTPFIDSIGVDIRLFKAQKIILTYLEDLLVKNSKYRVIWKLDPTQIHGDSPLESEIKNVELARHKKRFSDLVCDASMIILDAPGTTCLEACATRKPIFALLNRISWFIEAEDLLKRRAVVAYTPEELVEKIDRYIKAKEYAADINNRDFIRSYGTHFDDGRSTQRAIDFISQLMKN